MARLTAAEARRLAGKTVDEKVEDLLIAVETVAKNKKRRLRTGWDYKLDTDLWVDGGYKATPEWKEAKDILTKLGYKVSFRYHDGSMAVDMYTLVEW